MKKFIEIVSNGKRMLINTRHIRVVESAGSEGTLIFLSGNDHDFYITREDYNKVVRKIEEAMK